MVGYTPFPDSDSAIIHSIKDPDNVFSGLNSGFSTCSNPITFDDLGIKVRFGFLNKAFFNNKTQKNVYNFDFDGIYGLYIQVAPIDQPFIRRNQYKLFKDRAFELFDMVIGTIIPKGPFTPDQIVEIQTDFYVSISEHRDSSEIKEYIKNNIFNEEFFIRNGYVEVLPYIEKNVPHPRQTKVNINHNNGYYYFNFVVKGASAKKIPNNIEKNKQFINVDIKDYGDGKFTVAIMDNKTPFYEDKFMDKKVIQKIMLNLNTYILS